jgi:hypothetical protein
MAARNGRFKSNFLTLQGKHKHTSRGYSHSHICNFPLYSRFMEQDHRPRVQMSTNHGTTLGHGCSCTHHVPMGTMSRWWEAFSSSGSIRYLSLSITEHRKISQDTSTVIKIYFYRYFHKVFVSQNFLTS